MDIPFTYQGHAGRVSVSVTTTQEPEILGSRGGSRGLANCTATVEFAGRGYWQLFGWVQLVRSDDNAFRGRQFEVDPFDPFGLYKKAPNPYCWYGITPTLFDAPSRAKRTHLDWVAHSFLAASPLRGSRRIEALLFGNRRVVTPLPGFAWGFHIGDDRSVTLEPLSVLGAADWEAHLPYLRDTYHGWQFRPMAQP